MEYGHYISNVQARGLMRGCPHWELHILNGALRKLLESIPAMLLWPSLYASSTGRPTLGLQLACFVLILSHNHLLLHKLGGVQDSSYQTAK